MNTLLRLALCALLLPFLTQAALADGFIIIEEPPPMPHVIERRIRHFPLEVKFHKVEVSIDHQVAVTKVDQVFFNPNPRQLEGTYIFPLPADAAISKFSLWINGEKTEGEVLERNQARAIYEGIVRRMQDPALLEYMGRGMFKARVFPIPANGERRIALEYTQVINPDHGLCQYQYPLNTEKFSAKPLETCSIAVEIASGVPLRFIGSPTHEVDVRKKDEHHAKVSWEAHHVTPDTDFMLNFALAEADFGVTIDSYREASDGEGFFFAMLAPKVELEKDKVLPKDVVFVIDTSGSMAGPKMAQAQRALRFCVNNLNEGDGFNIVPFSTEPRPYREKMVEASKQSIADADAWVADELKAKGGTDLFGGLSSALDFAKTDAKRPFFIILISDGKPTIGETTNTDEILKRIRKRNDAGKVRLHCFGIEEKQALDIRLLDLLAEENGGTRDYALASEDIEIKVSNFYAKVANPVLSNLKLRFEGLEAADIYPKKLPDLFHGTQLTVFGRYKSGGDKAVVLTGNVGDREQKFVYEGAFTAERNKKDYIARLWAQRKVAYLIDNIRLHGEEPEVKEEIIQLAKRYGLMTPYTSYLVTEDEHTPRGDDFRARNGSPSFDGDGARAGENRPMRRLFGGATPPPATSAPMPGHSGRLGAGGAEKAQEPASPAEEADSLSEQLGRLFGQGSRDEMKSELGKRLRQDAQGQQGAVTSREQSRTKDKSTLSEGERSEAERRVIRRAGTRTFYQIGNRWVDSEYDEAMKGRIQRVKYLSDEYFELAGKGEFAQYLALGDRVLVVFGERIIEITPDG